jgi:excisionase family DNA binding protein
MHMKLMTKLDPQEQAAPVNGAASEVYEPFIDKRECAKRLGKSLRTLDTYIATGRIPYYKTGHCVSFKWSEVDRHWTQNYGVCLSGRI